MDFTAKMGVLLTQQTTGVERIQVRFGRPLRAVARAYVSIPQERNSAEQCHL